MGFVLMNSKELQMDSKELQMSSNGFWLALLCLWRLEAEFKACHLTLYHYSIGG